MIYQNQEYLSQIKKVLIERKTDIEFLNNKTVLITGATGLIGSSFIDLIITANKEFNLNVKVVALSRNEEKAKERFSYCFNDENFKYISTDVNSGINVKEKVDFIIHAASNTHPLMYSTDPVGTIETNVIGLKNVLELAKDKNAKRTLFLSSVEIYGQTIGDADDFDENYCGYINCNTLRAGYTEAKRLGEALCQAYISKYGMDIILPRISRVYGPTLQKTDTKAMSQFLFNALSGEDIVLKSEGKQYFSYCYMLDVVSAMIYLMKNGTSGEAYNVAGANSDITLADLAKTIASSAGTKVVFELPSEIERKGYSKAGRAILNIDKIKSIGWKPIFSLEEGISSTLSILKA